MHGSVRDPSPSPYPSTGRFTLPGLRRRSFRSAERFSIVEQRVGQRTSAIVEARNRGQAKLATPPLVQRK
jgi:hypothetical protein